VEEWSEDAVAVLRCTHTRGRPCRQLPRVAGTRGERSRSGSSGPASATFWFLSRESQGGRGDGEVDVGRRV
jgi:hypothetical protein